MPQAAATVGHQRFAVQVSKQNVTHRGGVESWSEESIMDTNFQRAAGQGAAQDGHRVHTVSLHDGHRVNPVSVQDGHRDHHVCLQVGPRDHPVSLQA